MSVPTSFLGRKLNMNSFLANTDSIHYQLPAQVLAEQTVLRGEGKIASNGALVINTGEFTGRSPKDKFIVKDAITTDSVHWNDFNIPFDTEKFDALHAKMNQYLADKELWVRDCYACADSNYRISIRVVNENPWSNLFAYNMFIRPEAADLEDFKPDWQILQVPGFKADPETDGTRQHNFAVVNFTKKIILIGGTGYTGEMKKGIFSVLNFILPHDKQVLSMHCSANMGAEGDTAIFFGLSGTGKTTLSADPNRKLIGDDEHGWINDSVFNFEGGCYAKTIDLTEEKEPEIFAAIKPGALLENVGFIGDTNEVDYANKSLTENTRVSYPLHHIGNALQPSIGKMPKNIFFLTCDANGVLPPISKLTVEQAMYQFISGYTAKIAGTEAGITEPKSTFSACFGAPFLPLHPGFYAKMLGEQLKASGAKVWLVNTGWTGGAYGIGSRIKLKYTRAMITAALNGQLNDVGYDTTPWFKLAIPTSCPDVPSEILNARNTWADGNAFDEKAKNLAKQFVANFEKYKDGVDQSIVDAAPKTQS